LEHHNQICTIFREIINSIQAFRKKSIHARYHGCKHLSNDTNDKLLNRNFNQLLYETSYQRYKVHKTEETMIPIMIKTVGQIIKQIDTFMSTAYTKHSGVQKNAYHNSRGTSSGHQLAEKFNIMINRTTNTSADTTMNGEKLEEVTRVKYLGATMSKDCTSTAEVRIRIAMATVAIARLSKL